MESRLPSGVRWTCAAVALLVAGCSSSKDSGPQAAPPTVQVARGVMTPADGEVYNQAQNVSMLQFTVRAGNSEDVIVRTLSFHGSGSGNETSALSQATLYRDLDNNGIFSSGTDALVRPGLVFDANDGICTASSLNLPISAGATETFLLLYYFNGSAAASQTFAAGMGGPGDVLVEGASTGLAAEVALSAFQGRTVTIKAHGTLDVAAGGAMPAAAYVTPPAALAVLQVKLSAGPVEAVLVNSIAFTASGTGHDVNDLSQVALYADGGSVPGSFDTGDTLLASGAFGQDDGAVSFAGLSRTIAAGAFENWILVHSFSGGAPAATFWASVAPGAQVAGTGAVSGLPAVVSGSTIAGNAFTLRYGTLAVTRGTATPASYSLTPPTSGSAVLQVALASGPGEGVQITQVRFAASGTGHDVNDLSAIRLYDDCGTVKGSVDSGDVLLASSTYAADDGLGTFTVSASLGASSTRDWLLVYDFSGGTNGSTFLATHNPAAHVTATGSHSGRAVTPTGSSFVSNTVTVSVSGSTINWTPLNPGGPSAPGGLRGHSAVYDSNVGQILIYGGSSASGSPNGSTFNNDVWELSTATPGSETWNYVNHQGSPPASIWHSAVYDSSNGFMYVFGGLDVNLQDLPANPGDIWQYDVANTTWKQITTQGGPPKPRCLHAVGWDQNNMRMFVYGGYNYVNTSWFNEAWELDFSQSPPNWTQISLSGSEPSSEGMASCYDGVVAKRVILFGGYDSQQGAYDSNTYDLDPYSPNWQTLSPSTVPTAMSRMCGAADLGNARFYMFGGMDSKTCYNDTYLFDFNQNDWTKLSPGGTLPGVRCESAGAWDSANSRFILYGGDDPYASGTTPPFSDCQELK